MAYVYGFEEKLPKNCLFLHMILKKYSSRKLSSVKGKIQLIRNKTDKVHAKSIRLRLPYALSSIRCILLIHPNRDCCRTRFTRSSYLEMVLLTNEPCRHFEKTPWHILIFAFYVCHYLRAPQRRINSSACPMA